MKSCPNVRNSDRVWVSTISACEAEVLTTTIYLFRIIYIFLVFVVNKQLSTYVHIWVSFVCLFCAKLLKWSHITAMPKYINSPLVTVIYFKFFFSWPPRILKPPDSKNGFEICMKFGGFLTIYYLKLIYVHMCLLVWWPLSSLNDQSVGLNVSLIALTCPFSATQNTLISGLFWRRILHTLVINIENICIHML